MAETYRYKVLANPAISGGGTHVLYSNVTPNRQTVVTDVFLISNDAGARAYLLLNNQRIIRAVPSNAVGGFRLEGMFLVLQQGDELKLETTGPTPPKYFHVFVFGFERDNVPTTGDDRYSYKTVTGQIPWTSGAWPSGELVTIYTAPADTVFVAQSWWVAVDNPNRWSFMLKHNDMEFHQVFNITDSAYWSAGRRDGGKIILEPGQTLKIQATFASGVPVQALLWYFGGVERFLQP